MIKKKNFKFIKKKLNMKNKKESSSLRNLKKMLKRKKKIY